MKLVNSRGRVLLEVYGATAIDIDSKGFLDPVMYQYRGEQCGGNVRIEGLHATIEAIKADNPSAKLIGLLPEPKIQGGK